MKTTKTICVDADIWELFTAKYPRKASKMINDFLKSIILHEEQELEVKRESLDHKLKELAEQESKSKIEQARIKAKIMQIDEKEVEAKKRKMEEMFKLVDDLEANDI